MLSSRPFARSISRTRTSRTPLTVSAALSAGAKVKIAGELTVYHVPGKKQGLQVGGMQGEIVEDIEMYKGKKLSPTLQYKVQMEADVDGKQKKFFVHVAEHEVELV